MNSQIENIALNPARGYTEGYEMTPVYPAGSYIVREISAEEFIELMKSQRG